MAEEDASDCRKLFLNSSQVLQGTKFTPREQHKTLSELPFFLSKISAQLIELEHCHDETFLKSAAFSLLGSRV